MKAITLTQPWATLVAIGAKRIETRSWRTPHRGLIAIHAAKSWTAADQEFAVDLQIDGILPVPDDRSRWALQPLPLGAVIAVAGLADVHHVEVLWPPTTQSEFERRHWPLTELEARLGDYSAGRFAWLLEDAEALPVPIPARGALGLWEWSAS